MLHRLIFKQSLNKRKWKEAALKLELFVHRKLPSSGVMVARDTGGASRVWRDSSDVFFVVPKNGISLDRSILFCGSVTMASLVDYKACDYRAFIFVFHNEHGLMLLHCTRKKKKPPHWQLPGGHVDEPEFLQAGKAQKKNEQTSM